MAIYNSSSPYFTTPVINFYLSNWVNRPIPKQSDDLTFIINETYHLRPDLLAFDLYGNAGLWWVFAQRNPNTLTDPLGSFVKGVTIYLPKVTTLQTVLGI